MAKSTPLYAGFDVRKDAITVAHATGDRAGPPLFVGAIGTRQADTDKLIRRLHGRARERRFVYEAGPSGYGPYRYLTGKDLARDVVAPSLIPRRPGGKVKLDRRDAVELACSGQATSRPSTCPPWRMKRSAPRAGPALPRV